MNREEIIKMLQHEKPVLSEKFGVEEIALFGSYARNEQKDDSDIDVLVKLKEQKWSLLCGLWDYLEKKFSKKVDIVTDGKHLSVRFFNYVKDDLIYA